ncbi:MAG: hypothetical protein C5B43_03215 [Verrucomicrobia bacterium]|nr:MAG: hypothetical protein C5B43_03215 [Verrucomicrobiota bacterium]
MRNLLLISAIGIASLVKCFAVEVTVENPYKDISIRMITKEESKFERGSKKGRRYRAHKVVLTGGEITYNFSGNHWKRELDNVNRLEFAILLKANGQILPQKIYDASSRVLPFGDEFEEHFILNDKAGHIVYKATAKFKYKHIDSIKIKVLKATLEGEEFEKNQNS